MNEIKHTPGPWRMSTGCSRWVVRDEGGPIACVEQDRQFQEGNVRLIAAAPDMALVLEMIAAEADAGTVMIPSGLRLTIDGALIKAGRKAAPEPVRHVTIAGVDR